VAGLQCLRRIGRFSLLLLRNPRRGGVPLVSGTANFVLQPHVGTIFPFSFCLRGIRLPEIGKANCAQLFPSALSGLAVRISGKMLKKKAAIVEEENGKGNVPGD
jgi:hypothetical protein